MKRVCIALAFLVTLSGVGTAAAQRLVFLGFLPDPTDSTTTLPTEAHDVSADGRVVVGYAGYTQLLTHAFRWTEENGMQALPTLGGARSRALAVSADGSIVVGWAEDATGVRHAVRWLSDGTVQSLVEGMDFRIAEATDVSADGSVIVGWVADHLGTTRAFRWTESEGLMLLDLGQESDWSYAYGCSSDGSKIVGRAEFNVEESAFLWTPDTVYVLGNLGGSRVEALAVSDTGNVVVGWSYTTNDASIHAFRWTPEYGMQDISPSFVLNAIRAYDVSADGQIVVGDYDGRGFRWTPEKGVEELEEIYKDLLPDKPFVRFRLQAYGISPDGRYIVGVATEPETLEDVAYLLDTGISTAVEEATPVSAQPASLWPNPFREAVRIRFTVPISGHVRAVVYDQLGRMVRTLLEGPLAPGVHEVIWDGRSDAGVRLPAGVYLLQLQVGEKVQSQRITLLR